MTKVRVRFAPSPTGGLHIGGVRTALFNYLFARKNGGDFVLRIEDTDQTRFVEGAEEYIKDTLDWLSIPPDEGPVQGGEFVPYRQSERKDSYRQYAEQLVNDDQAYYAFDTPDAIEAMKEKLKAAGVTNPSYNASSRMSMQNSLTLSAEEVKQRMNNGDAYTIRLKVPQKKEIRFHDIIRGWVMVHAMNLDDKVLLKSDGMPTYHLANVVDDHLMEISHVIRGEEWLPSLPIHVLLYEFFGWTDSMPKFAHLPLLMKPEGEGKLSKRAAAKAGFPIFPLSWQESVSGDQHIGFKERGYLPEALINFLAFLGWNPGGERELFTLEELVQEFSLERVGKAGTRFDIEKAKWFNQYYLRETPTKDLVGNYLSAIAHDCTEETAGKIIELLKPRSTFPQDFVDQSKYFFEDPTEFDEKVIRKKWNAEAVKGLELFAAAISVHAQIGPEEAKELYSNTLNDAGINPGKVMQPLRLALTGQGSGPDLMIIIEIMGGLSVAERISSSINTLAKHID
ncbi:MAG: glutamate--tRNA ligase [Cytophagales bacterium]|nr:glutamate--tRNA ligase [Cytophagales bacterium]